MDGFGNCQTQGVVRRVADVNHPASVPRMRNRRIGQIILIVGNLLMVATFFMPWLELETSFCSTGPRCQYHYGPWYLIRPGVPGYPFLSPVNLFLPVLACELIIIVCSAILLASHNRRVQRISLWAVIGLCGVCLFITFLIMTELYVALAFVYPFYAALIAYGSWVALASFFSIFAGANLASSAQGG